MKSAHRHPRATGDRVQALAVSLALCGCAAGSQLHARADEIARRISEARQLHAEECAPREMAAADGNLAFARIELDQGNAARAAEHVDVASRNAQTALQRGQGCSAPQAAKPAAAAAPKVALQDSDGDGVPDADDLCPDVPGPASNHGCPVASDRDGDGVADEIDRCPDLPGPRENFGCPWPDRDRDGVADKDDRCPDVPGPPENFGCPREQTLVVVRKDRIELKQRVNFAPNRARILPDSYELLRQVAQALNDAPGVPVQVEGHTDAVGNAAANLKLSQARAEAVRKFLLARGVRPGQLVARGFGATRPLASNKTRAGKAKNRRVEFHMIEKGPESAAPRPTAKKRRVKPRRGR